MVQTPTALAVLPLNNHYTVSLPVIPQAEKEKPIYEGNKVCQSPIASSEKYSCSQDIESLQKIPETRLSCFRSYKRQSTSASPILDRPSIIQEEDLSENRKDTGMYKRVVGKKSRVRSVESLEEGEDAFLAVQAVQQGRVRVVEGDVRAAVISHADREGRSAAERVDQSLLA